MSICRARLRNTSIVWGQQPDPGDDQAVNSRLLVRRQKMHGSQRWLRQTRGTDSWWHLADRSNFRDWQTLVGEIPWSSVPKTTMAGLPEKVIDHELW